MILSLFILFSAPAFSAPPVADAGPANLSFSGQLDSKAPYRVSFTPPAANHFNLGAPAKVELVNGATAASEPGELEKKPQKVVVTFKNIAKLDSSCSLKASLFVCNDANTYCRSVKRNFDCSTLAPKN